ncbi:MAG: UDP-N-acetylmuramoyl-L-alanine--D-glutamate ligase [Planctomycetota bacterium]
MSRIAAIWGLGRLGGAIGAAIHLHASGYELKILDRASRAELEPALSELASMGGPEQPELLPEVAGSLDAVDLLVVNQAVHPSHPLLARARKKGIPCTQELDLALDAYPGRVIAVSGTNGKSTTASILARALRTGSDPVLLAGNIGRSLLLEKKRWRRDQWAVVEVSSAQAARLDTRRAELRHLVLTAIGRDHLDWHGSLGRYHHDKLRLLDAVVPNGSVHGLARCPVFARLGRGHERLRFRSVSIEPSAETPLRLDEAGQVRWRDRPLFHRDRLGLRGDFNLENAFLAMSLGLELASEPLELASRVLTFRGLPHRMQSLGRSQGIEFVDNASSTVAESSFSALETTSAQGRVHWVAGGRAKDPCLEDYSLRLAPLAESIHLFGEVAGKLGARLLRAGARVRVHDLMSEALESAWETAQPGDILLLSPGFASHDQYLNYRERAGEALRWWQAKIRKETVDSPETRESRGDFFDRSSYA